MAMASDYWKVVGDTCCYTYLEDIIEPESQLQRTMFLMDLKATIRRLHSTDVLEEEIVEDNARIDENQDSFELQYNPNENFLRDLQGVALSKKLQEMQVPIEARRSLVDTIMFEASESAWKYEAGGKILRMRVEIDLYVTDDDTDGDDGTAGEKLEASSTVCSANMEEMTVGSEATFMPFLTYHGGSIVEGLQYELVTSGSR